MTHNHDDQCPSCGRPMRRCAECGKKFAPLRDDAITCSDLCRVHRSRRTIRARKKEAAEAAMLTETEKIARFRREQETA